MKVEIFTLLTRLRGSRRDLASPKSSDRISRSICKTYNKEDKNFAAIGDCVDSVNDKDTRVSGLLTSPNSPCENAGIGDGH